VEADDPAELLASLRAHRRAIRARKKERRRAAKQAAAGAETPPPAGAAGVRADLGGGPAAKPAPAPEAPAAPSPLLALPGATPLGTLEMLANSASAAGAAVSASDAASLHSIHTEDCKSLHGCSTVNSCASSRHVSPVQSAPMVVDSRSGKRSGSRSADPPAAGQGSRQRR
jgi:hypothetical protein